MEQFSTENSSHFDQVLISHCSIVLIPQTSLCFLILASLGSEFSNELCYIFLFVVVNECM